MMRIGEALVAILLLFAIGWWVRGQWEGQRYMAALDSTRTDVAAYDSLQAARALADSAARVRLAGAETRTRAALRSAAAADAVADSLRGLLVAQVPDTVLRLVAVYDSTRQDEADSLRAAVAMLNLALLTARERWAAADSLAGLAQTRLHDALHRLEQIRPRHDRRRDVALFLVGAGTGYVLRH